MTWGPDRSRASMIARPPGAQAHRLLDHHVHTTASAPTTHSPWYSSLLSTRTQSRAALATSSRRRSGWRRRSGRRAARAGWARCRRPLSARRCQAVLDDRQVDDLRDLNEPDDPDAKCSHGGPFLAWMDDRSLSRLRRTPCRRPRRRHDPASLRTNSNDSGAPTGRPCRRPPTPPRRSVIADGVESAEDPLPRHISVPDRHEVPPPTGIGPGQVRGQAARCVHPFDRLLAVNVQDVLRGILEEHRRVEVLPHEVTRIEVEPERRSPMVDRLLAVQ